MDKFYLEGNTLSEKLIAFNSSTDVDDLKKFTILSNKLLEKDIENLKLRQQINMLLYQLNLK